MPMDILLSSRSGDMFFGVQHIFRLQPGSTIYYTDAHLFYKEAVEWIAPQRFKWEKVDENALFEHNASLLDERGEYKTPTYNGNLKDVSVVDMSENTLSLVEKTRTAFRKTIPTDGPLLIFPTAKASPEDIPAHRKEMCPEFIGQIQWPSQTLLCVEAHRSKDFSECGIKIVSKTLPELVQMSPCAIVGTCSFPVLFMCWLGFESLKIHFHPFTYPPRASIDHLGGQELKSTQVEEINAWINNRSTLSNVSDT